MKRYKYVCCDELEAYSDCDIVKIIESKSKDEYDMAVIMKEDTPKENKKIEKTNREDLSLGASISNEKIRNIDCYIFDKLDEIIDKVNGE